MLGESRWPPVTATLLFLVLNIALRVWLPTEGAVRIPWDRRRRSAARRGRQPAGRRRTRLAQPQGADRMSILSETGLTGGLPTRHRSMLSTTPPRAARSADCSAHRSRSVALAWLLLVAVLAAAGPAAHRGEPDRVEIANALAPLGGDHPLGTDGVGRDVLAQLLYGGRTSLVGALIVVVVAVRLGLPAGILAGYSRGRFDAVANWGANFLMACRRSSCCSSSLRRSGPSTDAGDARVRRPDRPGVFRLVRASVVGVREELYVDAARVSGLGDARIMRRHILPVVHRADGHPDVADARHRDRHPGRAGVPRPRLGEPGQLGRHAQRRIPEHLQRARLLLWPGLAIVLTVTAFGLLGNALRDSLGVTGAGAPRAPPAAVRRRPGRRADRRRRRRRPWPSPMRCSTCRTSGSPTRAATGRVRGGERGVARRPTAGRSSAWSGSPGPGKSQTAFAVLGLLPPQAKTTAGA